MSKFTGAFKVEFDEAFFEKIDAAVRNAKVAIDAMANQATLNNKLPDAEPASEKSRPRF